MIQVRCRDLFMWLSCLVVATFAAAQQPIPLDLFAQMEGDWEVTSRIWTGPGATPDEQPPATAHREVPAGGGFLEERLTGGAAEKKFTRLATLGYNANEQVYEYASIDTRAPQLMHYRTSPTGTTQAGALRLGGGSFVVAEWGKWRNTRFAYRIELSLVLGDHQTLKIYFKPQTKAPSPEFLATQYDYVHKS